MTHRVIALVLVFTLLISKASTESPFSQLSDSANKPIALIFHIPTPTHELIKELGWHYFHACAFEFPIFLDYAQKYKLPVIIALPERYEKVATTGEYAPIMEGARVALAWASTYFRFKNVDVRFVVLPQTHSDDVLLRKINHLIHEPIAQSARISSDESIYHRFFKYESLPTHNSDITAEPITLHIQPKDTHTISPRLPSAGNGSKRIVITGGSGFIGSHLARALITQGNQVIVLDNLVCSTTDNISDLRQNPHFEFHQIDVSNPFDIEGPIDIIVHLASVPSPEFYYKMPFETLRSGLDGTKMALDLAARKNARFLFGSTSEVYGDPEVHPQPEDYPGNVDPIGKRSQYDQSKRGAETLLKLYFEKYALDIRIVRIFNTYGPGMQLGDGRVVTNFIRAALENKPLTVHGDGKQTRSFAYVSDTVDGIMRVMASNSIGTFSSIQERIFNVGNPGEFTINEAALMVNDLCKKYLGRDAIIRHIPQFDATDPKIRKPDISRIYSFTEYSPRVLFAEGLEKTFLFYFKKN